MAEADTKGKNGRGRGQDGHLKAMMTVCPYCNSLWAATKCSGQPALTLTLPPITLALTPLPPPSCQSCGAGSGQQLKHCRIRRGFVSPSVSHNRRALGGLFSALRNRRPNKTQTPPLPFPPDYLGR